MPTFHYQYLFKGEGKILLACTMLTAEGEGTSGRPNTGQIRANVLGADPVQLQDHARKFFETPDATGNNTSGFQQYCLKIVGKPQNASPVSCGVATGFFQFVSIGGSIVDLCPDVLKSRSTT